MFRHLLFLFSLYIGLTVAPAATPGSLEGVPDRDTPRDLIEAWLHFHESDLCQGMDADFVFAGDRMEVRSIVEDNRSYQRLSDALAPLRNSQRVELRRVQAPENAANTAKENLDDQGDKKDPRDPPPSLWENYELRSFLGDPEARALENAEDDDQRARLIARSMHGDEILKQRLLIYAEQTLASSRKIERYAKDIPALTRVAQDQGIDAGLRSRASAACSAHAQNLANLVQKLTKNLEPAFPQSKRGQAPAPEKSGNGSKTLVDRADNLSDFAQTVTKRVYQFIHPEHFAVSLDELRQPSLLESLRKLQRMDSEFQKALAKKN